MTSATHRVGARLVGWGAALPSTVVTNHDLARTLDTSDDWVVSRTGIRERRWGASTAALATDAAVAALGRAERAPGEIDALVLATTTPDVAVPATATEVQWALGTRGPAIDVNAACAGFVHGLVLAAGLLATGTQRALVVGAETLSRLLDHDDRTTAVLFGDGAGAVVLERAPAGDGGDVVAHVLGNDPTGRHLITAPLGGPLAMQGQEVFRRAVRVVVESARTALASADLRPDEIDVVVPHQANQRILDAAADRLGIARERWVSIVGHTGNTSAASIPMALVAAAESGQIRPGSRVLLVGFGAGMSWGAAVLRWSAPVPERSDAGSGRAHDGPAGVDLRTTASGHGADPGTGAP